MHSHVAEAFPDNRPLRLFWSDALHGAELYDGRDVATFTTDWHFHEGWQLVAVIRGERRYRFRSGYMAAQPGQLMVVPPRLVHQACCSDKGSTSFRIATLPPGCLHTSAPAMPFAWHVPKLFRTFLSVFEVLKAGKHGPQTPVLSGLEALLSETCPADTSRTSAVPAFVRRTESYLLQSLEKVPSLDELASRAGISPYHLSHAFTEHIGLPPLAFHARGRLLRARRLIADGRSLADTSLSLNFSDQSHFGRQFRKVYGMGPGEYRRSLASA